MRTGGLLQEGVRGLRVGVHLLLLLLATPGLAQETEPGADPQRFKLPSSAVEVVDARTERGKRFRLSDSSASSHVPLRSAGARVGRSS